MNYKIQAVETIELKRSVGTVDFERIEELDMLNDKCTDNCFSGELGVLVDCGWISYITVKYEQN